MHTIAPTVAYGMIARRRSSRKLPMGERRRARAPRSGSAANCRRVKPMADEQVRMLVWSGGDARRINEFHDPARRIAGLNLHDRMDQPREN